MPGCSLRGGGGPLVLLWALTLPLVSLQRPDRPKLLLLSFDGFRWDYIDRVPTPNFHNLIDDGVMVSHVENVYVTKTFPNHYSLVTGLYAETHGIVANEMYDPATGRSFSMETDSIYEPAWWEQAEPLWVTVQKAGGRSAAAMWPGSDVKIYGVYPSRYLPYNASVPFKDRVARIVRWFSGPEGEEVDFGVLYWEEPDESGHALGPQSPLMDPVIADIDEKLGFLVNALKEAGLYEKVNLVVTSDHGMAQLSPDKIIELDQYVTRDLYTWVDRSPVVALLPKEGKAFVKKFLKRESNPPRLFNSRTSSSPLPQGSWTRSSASWWTPTPTWWCTRRRTSPSASTIGTTAGSCPSSSRPWRAGPSCRTGPGPSCVRCSSPIVLLIASRKLMYSPAGWVSRQIRDLLISWCVFTRPALPGCNVTLNDHNVLNDDIMLYRRRLETRD